MKKFKKEDLLYNRIRAHPKVEFFLNNGVLFLDRNNYPDASSDVPFGSLGLFELVNKIYSPTSVADRCSFGREWRFLDVGAGDDNLAFE